MSYGDSEAEVEDARLMELRDRYKADLGRIAAAVYPHKEVPFTYSVDFVIDEIERARVREAELQALIGANSEELKSARTPIYRHTELAARVKMLEGVINAADRMNNEVCERVGIPPFGCDTADHLANEIERLRQREKTLEDALYRAINNLSHYGICRTAQTGNTRDCTCAIAELLHVLAAKEPERMPDKCIHGVSMAISCARCMDATPVGDCKCGHARMEHEPGCVFCDCAAYESANNDAQSQREMGYGKDSK